MPQLHAPLRHFLLSPLCHQTPVARFLRLIRPLDKISLTVSQRLAPDAQRTPSATSDTGTATGGGPQSAGTYHRSGGNVSAGGSAGFGAVCSAIEAESCEGASASTLRTLTVVAVVCPKPVPAGSRSACMLSESTVGRCPERVEVGVAAAVEPLRAAVARGERGGAVALRAGEQGEPGGTATAGSGWLEAVRGSVGARGARVGSSRGERSVLTGGARRWCGEGGGDADTDPMLAIACAQARRSNASQGLRCCRLGGEAKLRVPG